MDIRKAVKRVLPKHKHKFESLFEFDLDVVEDDNQESDGHDSVDTEFPSRVPVIKPHFEEIHVVKELPRRRWRQIQRIWTDFDAFYGVTESARAQS